MHEVLKGDRHITQAIQHAERFVTPILPTVKVVYCLEDSAIFTCQNLLLRSIQEKWQVPTRLSIIFCIHGRG